LVSRRPRSAASRPSRDGRGFLGVGSSDVVIPSSRGFPGVRRSDSVHANPGLVGVERTIPVHSKDTLHRPSNTVSPRTQNQPTTRGL
jgi:hypothetical protein